MPGFHTSNEPGVAKPIKPKGKPVPLKDPTPVNKKTLPGQHLIVPAGSHCPACERPADVLVFVEEGVQKCLECYGPSVEPLDLTSPKKTREQQLAEALVESLHRLDDSVAVWAALSSGAADDAIRQRIWLEWQPVFRDGEGGVAPGGKDYYCRPGAKGGKGAAFWFGYRSPAGKATLSGVALVAKVRDVLRIPAPKKKGKGGG